MVALKVGDTIWCHDRNYRTPTNPEDRFWLPREITGETKQSWLVGDRKINKVTLKEAGKGGYSGYSWYTAETMADRKWRHKHAQNIGTAVSGQDTPMLRAIAKLIGYDETKR